ncbi:T9SS type A sorting domain-containing protein [Mangrovibacterium sp.]|uniref:HYR-like domain-containing protein n=1 Tax=Mangrovibacterium sp. TaxID=1961364 RepID=UPI0035650F2E
MTKLLPDFFFTKKKYPSLGGIWGIFIIFLFFQFSANAASTRTGLEETIDNPPPVAICKNITIYLDASGKASITPEDIDDGSYDEGGPVILFVDIDSFDCDDAGDNTVRLIVAAADENDDGLGLCFATVRVMESDAPVPDATSLPDITAECEVTEADLTIPTATDVCAGDVSVTHDGVFPITSQGTTVITWTFEDKVGNTATQTQNVVIQDVTPPVPDMESLVDIIGECEVLEADLSIPSATDNCSGMVTVTHDGVFPITAKGTTVLTWTYDDGNGNQSIQTQNVIIEDTTPPTPDVATLADITDQCQVLESDLTEPTATDNCAGIVTVTNDASFPITTGGTTIITWSYTDGSGNTSTQTQNVVIEDITVPVPDAASLTDITTECEVTASDISEPTATDNCTGLVTGVPDVAFPITTKGTTVITWTFSDLAGNSAIQTQNIVIEDTTAPVPDAAGLEDITAVCEVAASDVAVPTATDNCSGSVDATPDITFPITTQGTTLITWTFTDDAGNSTTQTQNVVIEDVTPPVPDVADLADVTGECEITADDLAVPSATDNCAGPIAVTNDASFPIATSGTTVITWTYTDVAGNSTTQTQNVIIEDTTPPVPDAESLADVNAECEVTGADLVEPTATDNCAGTVTVTNDGVFPITTAGTTLINWTFEDASGNKAMQTQNVVIEDVSAPVADAGSLSDVTAECEVSASDVVAPTATDNCIGTVTGVPDVAFPITTSGTTVITWTYSDASGNSATQTQNVVIEDVTAPVADAVSLPDIAAECEVMASDVTVPTATDNCAGTVTGVSDVAFPITDQGTTIITWTYSDEAGNSTTQTQSVVIEDTTPPVADAESLTDISAQCEVEASDVMAPTATDNCSGSVIGMPDVTFPISTKGTTVITWTYSDAVGNSSTQMQNIVIEDTTAPVPDAEVLADVTAQCEIVASDVIAPTATDNCGGTVVVTNDAIFPITAKGTTVITWTYTDEDGNSSTQTQNAVIEDSSAPVADAESLADVTDECEVTELDLVVPTATDNCDETVTVTHDGVFPITAQGTTVITWTFEDASGNTSTQMQNVVIEDVTVPVADLASLPDVVAQCEVSAADLVAPTATDNCLGPVTVTNDGVFPINTSGTTVITWTYEDAAGNKATQTQNIQIEDSPIVGVTMADGNYTYDGSSHSLAVDGLPEGVTVTYLNNDQTEAGTYEVVATLNAEASSCSQVELKANLTIDKAEQTITFDEIPVQHLETDPDFSLSATASSGLPVTFTYTYTASTAPVEIDADGNVTVLTSGVVEITASQAGNDNYLPAESVVRVLTIQSSDASIHEITINGNTTIEPGNAISYVMDCGDNMEEVEVSFTTETNATVNIAHEFVIDVTNTGTYKKTIVVTSEDGTQTETYVLTVQKPYNFLDPDGIIIQKYNNVLLVNNNSDNNGGYRFKSFAWYINGKLVGTNQYYSAGENASNTLNANAEYYAILTAENGDVYRTCDFSVTLDAGFSIMVSPNPAEAGKTIDVITTYTTEMLENMKIKVTNLYGSVVLLEEVKTNENHLSLPSSLSPGTYVVTTNAEGVELSSKIIIK